MTISQHIPVMMKEAIEALNVRDNLDYIDATFGGGGYSKEILKKADCNLLSIDKDPNVKNYANKIKVKYKKRFTFVNDDFDNLAKLFSFPSSFKGFVENIQIANNENDIKEIYGNLINAAPQSKFAKSGRNYSEIKTSLNNKEIIKMRDDTYILIVTYTQKDKKNNSLIFSGKASYLFTKQNDNWFLSGVF